MGLHRQAQLQLPRMAQPFRDRTPFSGGCASARSAYMHLSRASSASTSFRCRSCDTAMPAYLFFHTQYVGSLMPCLRHVSATFAPASTSLRIRTIRSSLNFDLFVQRPSVGKLYFTLARINEDASRFTLASKRPTRYS